MERIICLLFGVLTGELGYLVVLGVCNYPEWLKKVSQLTAFAFALCGGLFFVCAVSYIGVSVRKRAFPWNRVLPWVVFSAFIGLGGMFTWGMGLDTGALSMKATPAKIEWFFAVKPFELAAPVTQNNINVGLVGFDAITWFSRALGRALEIVFAMGAAILSSLILIWDVLSGHEFEAAGLVANGEGTDATLKRDDAQAVVMSYKTEKGIFYIMDSLACVTWTAVVGVVSPQGLFGTEPQWWCFVLAIFGFLYFASAAYRLRRGLKTLGSLSSYETAKVTVI